MKESLGVEGGWTLSKGPKGSVFGSKLSSSLLFLRCEFVGASFSFNAVSLIRSSAASSTLSTNGVTSKYFVFASVSLSDFLGD